MHSETFPSDDGGRNTLKYDDDGHCIEKGFYLDDGGVQSITTYTYSSNHKHVRVISRDGAGKLLYAYDADVGVTPFYNIRDLSEDDLNRSASS